MRNDLLMVVGAAVAALVSVSALAQQTPDNSSYLNETITNRGLPHQAPAIGLSSIYGLNPCATGASLGVSTPFVGIGGSISTIDKDCETRNNAAVTVSALQDNAVAREIMCNIRDFREASLRLGKPCLADQRRTAAVAAPPAAVAAAAVPPPAAAAAAQDALPLPGSPGFCKLPGLVLSFYRECTREAAARPIAAARRPADERPASPRTGRARKRPGAAPQAVTDASGRLQDEFARFMRAASAEPRGDGGRVAPEAVAQYWRGQLRQFGRGEAGPGSAGDRTVIPVASRRPQRQ